VISRDGLTEAVACAEEIEVRSFDGLRLSGRWWRRAETRGVVVVAHGFGEHGGFYRRIAETLVAALDVDVVAVDFRGHGKSAGARGVVGQYDDLVGDLESVLEWVEKQDLSGTRFMLAHSNGAQVALRLVLRNPARIAGMILSNPALKVALPVAPLKHLIGRFLLRFAPGVTLAGEVRPELLTSDPVVQREHLTDPLRHSQMSAPLYFGMIEGGAMLLARAGEIKTPALVLLGLSDPVIDPAAGRAFHDRLGAPDKTLLVYPEMLHEPFSELGREQVFEDIHHWIRKRM
jgi:alpha-beta hydrolase superfamily lysophospholipase